MERGAPLEKVAQILNRTQAGHLVQAHTSHIGRQPNSTQGLMHLSKFDTTCYSFFRFRTCLLTLELLMGFELKSTLGSSVLAIQLFASGRAKYHRWYYDRPPNSLHLAWILVPTE